MSITNPDDIYISPDDQVLLDAVNQPERLTPAAALEELIRLKLRKTDEETRDGAALLVGLDTGLTQDQVLELAVPGKTADVSIVTANVLDKIRAALKALPGEYVVEL